MIEPQNTMLPLAESRPVDLPQGESDGFGAMLAQSLGMIPQVDATVVQQIDTGRRQNDEGAAAGDGDPSSGGRDGSGVAAVLGTPIPAGSGTVNQAPGGNPPDLAGEQPTPSDSGTGPSFVRSAPAGSIQYDRTDRGAVPMPVPPSPPSPEWAPQVTPPVDAIWKPSPLDQPVDGADDLAVQPSGPRDTIWHPAPNGDAEVTGPVAAPTDDGIRPNDTATPTRAPDINPPDVTTRPGNQPPVAANRDGSDLRLETGTPVGSPIRGERGPRLPRPPALDALRPGATGPVTIQPSVNGQQRVSLAPDSPVRLDATPATAEAVRPVAGRVDASVSEPTAVESSATIAAPVAETAAANAGPATAAGEVSRSHASALAERVMQAIDLQRTQPPPRSMVVDIPELEGLRLVVSVRSAGNVTVTPAGGSTNPDAFAPFATDLSRVLAERGFVMNGDGRQRGYNPYADDEPAPASPPRPGFRRPTRVDNDLRI